MNEKKIWMAPRKGVKRVKRNKISEKRKVVRGGKKWKRTAEGVSGKGEEAKRRRGESRRREAEDVSGRGQEKKT